MTEKPHSIDTTAVAELVRIRQDEDLLRQRLEKMESTKASVSEAVYTRVRSDYEARRAALENEARGPRERAGREYAKLRGLRQEAEKSVDEARLQKEELEFRHALGEFEDALFQERLSEAQKQLSAQQSHLDELVGVRDEFLKAFRSEDELEQAAKSSTPAKQVETAAPVAPVRPAAPASVIPRVETTVEIMETIAPKPSNPPPPPPARTAAPPPVPKPAPIVAPPPPRSSLSQALADAAFAGAQKTTPMLGVAVANEPDFSADATVVRPTPPGEGVSGRSEPIATMMMARSRIVVLVDEKPEKEYLLGRESTTIGRSAESTIHLPHHDVSRQHATIVHERDGYKIIDRGSPNGVFVNGDKISERVLQDGDVIQLGRRKLIFKA
ncbi:MAG: FHA domain-containing protein [Thermoanaerobaculia bacterium]